MRKFAITLAALAAVAASALPAFGQEDNAEGTVGAQVTVASPCITVTPDKLDFGVLGFSSSDQNATLSPFLPVGLMNCGAGAEDIVARGTDATSTSADTTWTLAANPFVDSVCPDPNVFRMQLTAPIGGGDSQIYNLISTDQQVVSALGTSESPAVTAGIKMPGSGSGGAGKVMGFSYIFTAMLA